MLKVQIGCNLSEIDKGSKNGFQTAGVDETEML